VKIVKTQDFSYTLFSDEYQESYHSIAPGAFSESFFKHVKPAIDYVLAQNPEVISILDICFGLGYNTLTTLCYLDQKKYMGAVEVFSPELDEKLVKELKYFPYPKELIFYSEVVMDISTNFRFNLDRFNITVLINDARVVVHNTQKQFDIIYQDAFSQKNNPSLWELEFFKDLFSLMKKDGILTTYSQSKKVRDNLKKAGFKIFEHKFEKNSNIRAGTIATKNHQPNNTTQIPNLQSSSLISHLSSLKTEVQHLYRFN